MHALPIPTAALRDEKAIHMLGAWIAEEGLHCSMNVGFFDANGHQEPAAWGMMLADVVRHIAGALNKNSGADIDSTIESIVKALEEELEDPTTDVEGDFVAKPS